MGGGTYQYEDLKGKFNQRWRHRNMCNLSKVLPALKDHLFYIGKATVHVTSLWWNIEFKQSNNCFSGRVLTNLNQNCEDRCDALSLLSLVVFHHPRAPWHGKWSTPFHQHLLSSHTGTYGTTHANDMQRKAVGRHPWTIKSSESAVP